jgi:lipopolysaccharide export system protein LptA
MRSTREILKTLLAITLLASFPFTAIALESDVDEPIEVEANSVEIDDKSGKSVYKGNVVLIQGSIRIDADRVTVIQHETKSDKITAVGKPVRITQKPEDGKKPVKGRSSRMEYDVDSELLYLIGNASITQDQDTFRSDRIAYNRKTSMIKGGVSAKGKHRVRVTIKSKKKNDDK